MFILIINLFKNEIFNSLTTYELFALSKTNKELFELFSIDFKNLLITYINKFNNKLLKIISYDIKPDLVYRYYGPLYNYLVYILKLRIHIVKKDKLYLKTKFNFLYKLKYIDVPIDYYIFYQNLDYVKRYRYKSLFEILKEINNSYFNKIRF